jgi:hypothetical protein
MDLQITAAQFDPRVKIEAVVNNRSIAFTMMADGDTTAYANDPYTLWRLLLW